MKSLLKQTLVIVALAGFALAPAIIRYFNLSLIQSSTAPFIAHASSVHKQERANPGLPVRLRIPNIKVDAAIEQVGLTSQGDMEVPQGQANAGWFNRGPRPGEIGSSVIDGHFGLANDVPGVFDNLSKLRKGDKLYIQDDKGVIIAFVVQGSRIYNPEADASDVFSSNDGKSHLNLITCEGAWDKTQKSYSERLVVFADRELP